MVATPLLGFIAFSLVQEESDLLRVQTSDRFDLNAYKLMKKSGYDFSRPAPLGNAIKARCYALIDTQIMIQTQGGGVATWKIGFSYVPS